MLLPSKAWKIGWFGAEAKLWLAWCMNHYWFPFSLLSHQEINFVQFQRILVCCLSEARNFAKISKQFNEQNEQENYIYLPINPARPPESSINQSFGVSGWFSAVQLKLDSGFWKKNRKGTWNSIMSSSCFVDFILCFRVLTNWSFSHSLLLFLDSMLKWKCNLNFSLRDLIRDTNKKINLSK